MYKDEQKALLLVKDKTLQEQLETYLLKRYNLRSQSVADVLGLFDLLGADDSPEKDWNLVILDENVAGLQTTSQTLKTLKTKYTDINVLYLSNILEITAPYSSTEMELLPEYANDEYRQEQIDMQLDKVLGLLTPLMSCTSLHNVYDTIPRLIVKNFHVDWALCSVLRLDEKPVHRGVGASDFPPVISIPLEYPLKGTGYLDQLLTHYQPIHIPDLNKDEPFAQELEEKFTRRYRSALLLPMQMDGKSIGFLGLFTRTQGRLYRLPELDILQRMADMSTVAIITHLYREHSNVDMDKIEQRVKDGDYDDPL
ncbi:MAG: GAF domain-containing protein [bacterium]|nr:GAF domain-containing protein [bacterium]